MQYVFISCKVVGSRVLPLQGPSTYYVSKKTGWVGWLVEEMSVFADVGYLAYVGDLESGLIRKGPKM